MSRKRLVKKPRQRDPRETFNNNYSPTQDELRGIIAPALNDVGLTVDEQKDFVRFLVEKTAHAFIPKDTEQ